MDSDYVFKLTHILCVQMNHCGPSGVIKMSLGEKAKLLISSDYGYGDEGYPPVIPQKADLVFVVELLAIGDKEANIPSEGGCCVIL